MRRGRGDEVIVPKVARRGSMGDQCFLAEKGGKGRGGEGKGGTVGRPL